jgi:hypothetical protein
MTDAMGVKRLRVILVAVPVAVGFAAPAHADSSTPVTPAPPTHGDPMDDAFRQALANGGVLFDFPLEKVQGQRACHDYRRGESAVDVIHELMRYGSYS